MLYLKRLFNVIGCLTFCIYFLGCSKTQLDNDAPSPSEQFQNYMAVQSRLEDDVRSNTHEHPFLPTLSSNNPDRTPVQRRLSVQAENMDIRQFYLSLVEGTPTQMIIDPDVQGVIFLSVDLPLEDILDLVEQNYGYTWHKERGTYRISKSKIETKTYDVSYLAMSRNSASQVSVDASRIGGSARSANSTSIATLTQADVFSELEVSIGHLLSDESGASYQINPTAGLFVLKALGQTHKKVEAFLTKLNKNLHHQVLIEAKILEVKLSDGYHQGIDWSAIFKKGSWAMGQTGSGSIVSNGLESGLGQTNTSPLDMSGEDLTSMSALNNFVNNSFSPSSMGGIFKVGLFKNDFNLVLDLLAGQGQVQVLSSPRITTLNNQKALIRVGEEKKFINNVQASMTTQNSGGATTTTSPSINFETYFSGISLVVMPHIIDSGSMILHVHPAISTVTEDVRNISLAGLSYDLILPKNDIRESDSIIKVDNEQIVILGGLMKSEQEKERAYIPGFNKLEPLHHKKATDVKSELVILIKPVIMTADSYETIMHKQRQTLESFATYNPFEDR